MNESQELRAKVGDVEQEQTRECLIGCVELLDKLFNVSPYTGTHNVVKALVAYYGVRVKNE